MSERFGRTYTWGEMEAFRLLEAGGQIVGWADPRRDLIHEAAEYVIALAERIKSQRAVTATTKGLGSSISATSPDPELNQRLVNTRQRVQEYLQQPGVKEAVQAAIESEEVQDDELLTRAREGEFAIESLIALYGIDFAAWLIVLAGSIPAVAIMIIVNIWNWCMWYLSGMPRHIAKYEREHPGQCGMCSYYRYLNRECQYLGPPPEHVCKESS